MQLTEPTTLLTDYVLAIESAWFAVLLALAQVSNHSGPRLLTVRRLWALAFAGVAIAAFLGGTYHGFYPYLTPTVIQQIWWGVFNAVGFASVLILAATSLLTFPQRFLYWMLPALLVKLLVQFCLPWSPHLFGYAIADYLTALLLAALFLRLSPYNHHFPESFHWILAGFLVSCLGVTAQVFFSPFPYFNHNDLYHCIQMVALYFLFRGSCSFKTHTS